MTRLTRENRRLITDAVTKHSAKGEMAAFYEKSDSLAIKVFKLEFGHVPFNDIPDAFINYAPGVIIRFMEENGRLIHTTSLPTRQVFPTQVAWRQIFMSIYKGTVVGDEFTDEILALEQELKELQTAQRERESKLKSIMEGFNTVEKLIQQWPDIATFAEKYLEKKQKNLPNLQLAQLNSEFKLPPGQDVDS
jgi:hypothetical protein